MKKPKKQIKTRDYLMKRLIEGATKAGVHKDKKKEDNKHASREKVEALLDGCLQCNYPLRDPKSTDSLERQAFDFGFCSISCMDYYNETQYED